MNALTFRLNARQKMTHPFGYQYIQISYNRWLEVLILAWKAGIGSKPHNHQASINFTKVLSGQVLERKYHLSGGSSLSFPKR